MKKCIFFLSLMLVLLLIFACDFNYQLPDKVTVKGSPHLKVAAEFNLGGFLSDIMKDVFGNDDEDGFKILECTNRGIEYFTFLIHMDFINQEIDTSPIGIPDMPGEITIFIEGIPITINVADVLGDFKYTVKDRIVLFSSSEPITLPLDGLFAGLGDYLTDFEFNEDLVKAKIYVSGSEIIDFFTVELDFGSTDIKMNKTNFGQSHISNYINDNKYTASALPNKGMELPIASLLNKREDIEINFKIYLEAGTEIDPVLLNNSKDKNILMEMALWFPLSFNIASGTEMKFPEDLFSGDDLFGRDKPGEENLIIDMIESLDFSMKMSRNPFTNASLVVQSKGVNIVNELKTNSFDFAVRSLDMDAINDPSNFPFSPQIKIVFDNNATISLPREFYITEIAFKARLSTSIDIGGK
jgi:hypothetical protein